MLSQLKSLLPAAYFATGLCLSASHLGAQTRATDAAADDKVVKRKPTEFVRVLRDEFDSPVALQTATAKYVLKAPDGTVRLEVLLESAIHVGDRGYYRAFNQRFRHYDVVLYELVAPPERRVPTEPRGRHPFAILEKMAAEGLGFSRQIDEIDFTAENFVHSDLSPTEMAEAMKERGDDAVTMMADTLLHWVRQTNRQLAAASEDSESEGPPKIDLAVLAKPGGTIKLRRMFAGQFEAAGQLDAAIAPRQRTSLIDDRNARAMEVFQKQLDLGHKRIAFFWGAAHMPDFEKRLILEYDLEPAGVLWRNAWDLREGSAERAPLEALLQRSLRSTIEDLSKELLNEGNEDEVTDE